MSRPAVVGVAPGQELRERRRLLAALAEAFDVRFEPFDPARPDAVDGLIAFPAAGELRDGLPPIPVLRLARDESLEPRQSARWQLANDPALEPCLRSRVLRNAAGGLELPGLDSTDTVLAWCEAEPAWVLRRGRAPTAIAALAPAELQPTERLRERLTQGRFAALLPVVTFLRGLPRHAYELPRLRAAFVIDDPNLHWRSYGYLDYGRLAAHARDHGYHVGIAMIPRDTWYSHPEAVGFFRRSPNQLSLLIHGNDHVKEELARSPDRVDGVSVQALHRIERFERSTGIDVARVMVPPHGVYSEHALAALCRSGFEAACVSKPAIDVVSPTVLSDWGPVGWGRTGLPLLHRCGLEDAAHELAFRALLGQPLIVYGHSRDLASGLDVLTDASARIGELGRVEWMSLDRIARTNIAVRQVDDVLFAKLFSRRAEVAVPAGVTHVVVESAFQNGDGPPATVAVQDRTNGDRPMETLLGEPVPVPAERTLELELTRPAVPAARSRPVRAAWPVLRRALTEARDRAQPFLSPPGLPRAAGRGQERPTCRALILVQNLSVPTDRRVWQECLALQRAGVAVSVVCPQGPDRDTAPFEHSLGIEIHRYPPKQSSGGLLGYAREYGWALWQTWRLVRRLEAAGHFDVVHACNPPDALLLTALSARRRGAAFVFDHHDLVPELVQTRYGSFRPLLGVARLLERLSFHLADVVLATNDSYREVALTRGGKKGDAVVVVRNAPDLKRFRPQAPDPSLRNGHPFLLAYAGVMGPQDGVEHALHALGQLAQRRRDWRAIFAGEGEMLPGLRRLAVDLGIADAVEFSGWLDDSALLRVLSSADICLAPEPSNPLNDASTMVKVAEYMALSRTVVATDLPETRATAGDTALYARAGDADEFARRIDEALGDHAGRRALGERARHRVETTLSWERSVQALLRAYRLALTRRGRSPHGARTIDPEPDAGS